MLTASGGAHQTGEARRDRPVCIPLNSSQAVDLDYDKFS